MDYQTAVKKNELNLHVKVQRGMVHQDFKKTDTSDEAGKG